MTTDMSAPTAAYAIGVLEAYERGAKDQVPLTDVRRFIDGVRQATMKIGDTAVLLLAPVDYRRVIAGNFQSSYPHVRVVQDSNVFPILEK